MDNEGAAAPRRRRLRPAERREEILLAATDMITEIGFNSASLDDFAHHAGISKAGLLHHFPSKDKLLAAVLDRRDRLDISSAVDVNGQIPSAAVARVAIRKHVEQLQERPELVQLYIVLSTEALSLGHPAHDYFRDRAERSRALFAAWLRPWYPQPEEGAVQVISQLDGLQLAWLRDPKIDIVSQWEMFARDFFGHV